MSRLISDVLNAREPHFSHVLKNLEHKSGNNGQDVRLMSEIVQQRKRALAELKLDETDTTPRELFFALCHRAADTNQALVKELGITADSTPRQVISKIAGLIDTLPIQREVWVIKPSVIKQLLIKQPPKKLLKILGLRSIDSVLKRTGANELLTLAYQVESSEWSLKMRARYKKLKPVDFQSADSSICVTEESRVKKLHKGGYKSARIAVPNYETGTLLIVPPANRFRLDVLALTLAILQSLYDLRLHSAYFRLISVKSGFSNKFHTALQKGLPGNIHENKIGWAVLQRHFSDSPDSFAAVEQPQLQHNDVEISHPMNVLATKLPAMDFWSGRSHIFMVDGSSPVSMHLMDVITNTSNQVPYENRVNSHLQRQLWEELGLRYLENENVRSDVMLFIDEEQF